MISAIYIQNYNDASETLRREIAEMLQQIGRMLLMILNCPIRLNLPLTRFSAALTENWSHTPPCCKRILFMRGYCFVLPD